MLSIVLPTYNEAANLPEMLARLRREMDGREYEVIVVDDDSPDGTWRIAEELQSQYPMLRVLRRVGRRGLSSAVTEGFAMAKGDILLVMDSDLQHDPSVARALWEALEQGSELAVASRYTEGGSVGEWVRGRRILSRIATFLARKIPPVETSDPMSGFFALRASAYRPIADKLRPVGFKILLEILAHLPVETRVTDVPLVFQLRTAGESKLSMKVQIEFLEQLFRIALLRVFSLLSRAQWVVFFLLGIVVFFFLAARAWALRALIFDPATRSNVRTAIERHADREGWLLSDLSVQSITSDHVRVYLRFHHRGPDETQCLLLPFDASPPLPCVDS